MSRRDRALLATILATALLLRLVHVHELSRDVLFESRPLDEGRYLFQARNLLGGLPFEPRAFWQPPGIMYALGAIFALFGNKVLVAAIVQAIVGTIACALTFVLGRRAFCTSVGLLASAIVALNAPLIFAGGELLPAIWAATLDLGALVLLLDAKQSLSRAVFAGLLLGLSALFTPIVLPFAALAALWLVRSDDRRGALALLGAVALAIAPVTIRNYLRSGELVLVSTNGGLNFFLGSNERYFETIAVRPGPRWSELSEEPLRIAHLTRPGEQSAYFLGKGLAFWRHHPVQAIGLYLRKVWLFFSATEIPRDGDLYVMRDESRVLRALSTARPFPLPGALLMPLAALGSVTMERTRERLVLLSFVAVQALSVAAFFVSARYRVPALPVLSVFAAAGLVNLARVRFPALAVATIVLVVALLPAREASLRFDAERELFRGLALRKSGDQAKALDAFDRATALDPTDARPWFERGNALAAQRRPLEAAAAWERAGACDPWDLRALRSAANARAEAGDIDGAIAALQRNIAAAARPPNAYATDWMLLAALHAGRHQPAETLVDVRGALAADRELVRAQARGFRNRFRSTMPEPSFWTAFDELVR